MEVRLILKDARSSFMARMTQTWERTWLKDVEVGRMEMQSLVFDAYPEDQLQALAFQEHDDDSDGSSPYGSFSGGWEFAVLFCDCAFSDLCDQTFLCQIGKMDFALRTFLPYPLRRTNRIADGVPSWLRMMERRANWAR